MNDFAVFILTHGRPEKQITYNTIKKQGYTGRIVFIVDDEDETVKDLKKNYPKDEIEIFNKKEIAKTFDTFDLSEERRTIVFARNASFEIAEKIGVKYFIQFDDDYTDFHYVRVANGKTTQPLVKNMDKVLELFLNYYKENENILTLCMIQGGDLIGGAKSGTIKNKKMPFKKRKVMNSFICSTDRPYKFIGRINEDVNTYTTLGGRGEIMLSIPQVKLVQKQTQSNKGGMTDIYLDKGTYLKSFYTVITRPDCTTVALMGDSKMRLHHSIKWENAIPKILSEKYKK